MLTDSLSHQFGQLLLLAIPVACIAWTVTHEEIVREAREICKDRCGSAKSLLIRKFFYVFTCEYCFSHYVVIFLLAVTRYHLLYDDWRGYLIAGFSMVWIANCYMSIYAFLRINLKLDQLSARKDEQELDEEG